MRKLLVLLFIFVGFGSSAASANYCLAIRGNGELAPAHWGALANVVERLGLPQLQAGGSSASITMFLLDAVASNPFVAKAPDEQTKRERVSTLLKSFEGFLNHLAATQEWNDFLLLQDRLKNLRQQDWLAQLIQALALGASSTDAAESLKQNRELIERNFKTGVRLGLVNPQGYAPLIESIQYLLNDGGEQTPEHLRRAYFYATELQNGLKAFGAFHAETDHNIFFRPNLVNFDLAVEQIGKIADFYALNGADAHTVSLWANFFKLCSTDDLLWHELPASSACHGRFQALVHSYYLGAKVKVPFFKNKIGYSIPTLPITSVLVDSAHEQAQKALSDYHVAMDPTFGQNFKLNNPEDVRIGYWGSTDLVSKITVNVRRFGDEKSRRFMGLGLSTWKKPLTLSPAEPGLAPFQSFVSEGRTFTSAGGWPDLAPTLVLRAAGCHQIVYLTREGGESVFAQGVAKRIYNADFFEKLHRLDGQSSLRTSLDEADAILCTKWNDFNVKKDGVKDLISNAYRSPYFVRASFQDAAKLTPRLEKSSAPAGCF